MSGIRWHVLAVVEVPVGQVTAGDAKRAEAEAYRSYPGLRQLRVQSQADWLETQIERAQKDRARERRGLP